MAETAGPPIEGPALVKLVTAVLEAAGQGDRERSVDGLRQLGRSSVTTSLLLSTGAGKKIRKLAKAEDAVIAKAAEEVVQAWKEAVKREQGADMRRTGSGGSELRPSFGGSGDLRQSSFMSQDSTGEDVAAAVAHKNGAAPPQSSAAAGTGNGAPAVGDAGPGKAEQPSGPTQSPTQPGAKSAGTAGQVPRAETAPPAAGAAKRSAANGAGMIPPKTGVGPRDKMRQLLADALAMALPEVPGGEPGTVAAEVETALFNLGGGVTTKYKTKFRSLSFNLKDANNPDLRRRVLAQEVDADRLMHLTPEELASDTRKEENAKIREHALWDAERGPQKKATTDQFQCGKCRQRKCTYYQMQTRSADEPMTTFVTCLNCDKRWKFS